MKVRIPLIPRSSGGIDCPYPLVTLLVRDVVGELIPMRFRVDTGSDCVAMPAAVAQNEGIPFQKVRASQAHGLVGTAHKYRDLIRIVLAGRFGAQESRYRAAGVTDSIYMGCNVIETLTNLLQAVGVEP